MADTVNFVITEAGRNALVNSDHTGLNKVVISRVVFGSGQFTPTTTSTGLVDPIDTTMTIAAGKSPADGVLHVSAYDTTTAYYNVREVAIYATAYTDTDTEGTEFLLALWSDVDATQPLIQKTSTSIAALSFDISIGSDGIESIESMNVDVLNPEATTELKGVIELLTQEEFNLGTDGTRAVTTALITKALGNVMNYLNSVDESVDSDMGKLLLQIVKAAGGTSFKEVDTLPDELEEGVVYSFPDDGAEIITTSSGGLINSITYSSTDVSDDELENGEAVITDATDVL